MSATHATPDAAEAVELVGAGAPRRGPRAPGASGDAVLAIACGAVLLLALIAALAPGLLAPGDPIAVNPREAFRPLFSPGHPLGTDESGRDLWTRLVHGAGASLAIGGAATAIGIGLGALLGAVAALGGRVADWITARVVEVGFAFPLVLLALLLVVLSGPGAETAAWSVGLATAPGYARIIRSELRRIARSGYVEAERALGRGRLAILARTIAPNAAGALLALATLGLGQAIVWASGLSFLDLGVRPPAPEWGAMLSAGRGYLSATGWWITVVPGTAIVVVALAATLLGRAVERMGRRR